ncbi:hypothetical protein AMAG_01132 [Allomyces macrogynus ATCC 38327]|uniref:C2 domain-containing protein n=1 Tax=Allomyces macrogynus (strain ATCC 38327) TaxID=578462 RepID=A0A0L0RXY6_ALLM3|nr:hypothetical protein AMAG_01132 [Allomyces macrogynus ATCC 38327]|eukprot:KNE55218.1 hypothetical protein AMAG_01132 [Allomyces macrogynus ATCC 38327]
MAQQITGAHLTVVEARNLVDSDAFGKADPYVVCTAGTWKKETKVQKATGANPMFNERFEVDIAAEVKEIVVEIYDKDHFRPDDLMGRVVLPVHEITGTIDRWYQLYNKAGAPAGELRLSAYPKGSIAGHIHDVTHGFGEHNPLGKLKQKLHKHKHQKADGNDSSSSSSDEE